MADAVDNASSLGTCRLVDGPGTDCVVIVLLCWCAVEKIGSALLTGCREVVVEGGCCEALVCNAIPLVSIFSGLFFGWVTGSEYAE